MVESQENCIWPRVLLIFSKLIVSCQPRGREKKGPAWGWRYRAEACAPVSLWGIIEKDLFVAVVVLCCFALFSYVSFSPLCTFREHCCVWPWKCFMSFLESFLVICKPDVNQGALQHPCSLQELNEQITQCTCQWLVSRKTGFLNTFLCCQVSSYQ